MARTKKVLVDPSKVKSEEKDITVSQVQVEKREPPTTNSLLPDEVKLSILDAQMKFVCQDGEYSIYETEYKNRTGQTGHVIMSVKKVPGINTGERFLTQVENETVRYSHPGRLIKLIAWSISNRDEAYVNVMNLLDMRRKYGR